MQKTKLSILEKTYLCLGLNIGYFKEDFIFSLALGLLKLDHIYFLNGSRKGNI